MKKNETAPLFTRILSNMSQHLLNPIPKVLSFYTDKIAIEYDLFSYLILECVDDRTSNRIGTRWKPCHTMDRPKILLLRSCSSLNTLGKAMLHIVRTGASRYEQEYKAEVFTTLFYMIVESEYVGLTRREYMPILQRSRHTPNVHPRENPLNPSFVHGRYLYPVEPHPCIDEPLQRSLWALENIDQIQETLQRFIRPSYIPHNEIPQLFNEIQPAIEPPPPIEIPEPPPMEEFDQYEEPLDTPAIEPPAIPSRIASILLQDAETKNEICPISMEPIQLRNSSVTSCYHLFRTEELLQWNQTSNLCPVCKATMVFTTPSIC